MTLLTLFGFFQISLWDLVDVFLVAFIFYKLILIIRDMHAVPLFIGLLIVVISSMVANWLELAALSWLIEMVRTIWLIGFLIIFQPELRRALNKLGQSRLFQVLNRHENNQTLELVIGSARNLAHKGLGALMVLIRDANLINIIETGTTIQAKTSEALIETIFTPPSPLHDGALMIKDDMLIAAGCILPITQNQELDKRLGLRHRAALGLSEDSDAIILVVSEEVNQISLAYAGHLYRNLSDDEIYNEIIRLTGYRETDRPLSFKRFRKKGVMA